MGGTSVCLMGTVLLISLFLCILFLFDLFVFVLSFAQFCPIDLFLLTIAFSVLLRLMDYDDPFGLFKCLLFMSLDCLFGFL